MKKTLLLSILALSVALIGCQKNQETEEPGEAKLTTFVFLAENNAECITEDVIGVIDNSQISLSVPFGTDVSALVASFEAEEEGTIVKVGETVQESGYTANDFSNLVSYGAFLSESKYTYYTVTVTVLSEEEVEEEETGDLV